MSDEKVVSIRTAIKDAKPAGRAKKKADRPEPPAPPPPGDGTFGPPRRLPDTAPVRALGRDGSTYYVLDCTGQFTELPAESISRNNIISLFGGSQYLIDTWPAYDKNGDRRYDEFKHGLLSPVLMSSCTDRPIFDPRQLLRSLGTWAEEDGTLVFHCGDVLHIAPLSTEPYRTGTGMRGKLLYPSAKAIPEPLRASDRDGPYSAAGELYKMLRTWNWYRGDTDAKMMFGWICAALLGGAQPWRPMVWVTGDAGSGKSALSKLVEWVLGGDEAIIKSDNATSASIFQLVGQSSLPVVLDEVEAKPNNKRAQEIVELARLAASGGKLTRGGADGTPLRFTARNCFFFSSILLLPLQPQDLSRMAILRLDKIEWDGAKKRGELDAESDDEILGRQKDWVRVGRELRGNLMAEWPRYRETYAAYRRALHEHGHDARGADQFGALGTAYDCGMESGIDAKRALAWGKMLPASELQELRARDATANGCLVHLLGATLDVQKGGRKHTVIHWLRQAMRDKKDKLVNEYTADQVLRGAGIVLFRDAGDEEKKLWWVAVSNTHQELKRIYDSTKWAGEAGARGTWVQALERIAYARPSRLRIDGVRHYVTLIPWEAINPPMDDADKEEVAIVALEDRED